MRLLAPLALAVLLLAAAAWPCFGTRLRIAVGPERAHALASYALGYYLEEKTGVEPEFVPAAELSGALLTPKGVDLLLAAGAPPAAPGTAARPAGEVPGLGAAVVWIRGDVLDDLRFSTVDRALARAPAFFGSSAYHEALRSGAAPRKAARRAVLGAR